MLPTQKRPSIVDQYDDAKCDRTGGRIMAKMEYKCGVLKTHTELSLLTVMGTLRLDTVNEYSLP